MKIMTWEPSINFNYSYFSKKKKNLQLQLYAFPRSTSSAYKLPVDDTPKQNNDFHVP